jgi:hypothetical protein
MTLILSNEDLKDYGVEQLSRMKTCSFLEGRTTKLKRSLKKRVTPAKA